MRRSFDLVIFDCDGVLINSKEANRAYYDDILAHFDLGPMDEEELAYVHMHTAMESLIYLFSDCPQLRAEALKWAQGVDYSDYLEHLTTKPGFPGIVKDIRPPVLTGVSTNRSTTMPQVRKAFGFDNWFDMIMCALDVSKPKPHPEGVWKILRSLGIPAERAVYVGDSKVDEEVAKRVGLALVAYKNPCLDAMFHVKHFEEMKAFLFSK